MTNNLIYTFIPNSTTYHLFTIPVGFTFLPASRFSPDSYMQISRLGYLNLPCKRVVGQLSIGLSIFDKESIVICIMQQKFNVTY